MGEEPAANVYGPYPPSVPVPFINKNGDIPPKEAMDSAKSYADLGKFPDYRDVNTPDEWVPRDGRLIRLTGRHPLNVEPPIGELSKTRFITPSSLHFVRNHGACPRLSWEEHTIVVGGDVATPLELSMDELVAMGPHREIPVTLVCAGNRRKEQNMMRQTIGFNWGPCAVSTNVYKGCLLRNLLLAAGVDETKTRGMYVEFIGSEDLPNKVGPGPFSEEPWGKLVNYGTSVPLARAMNPAYDIMLAWEANGERLMPDHGFPVRVIIPGYIGARMVKWLKHINVIDHETRNHYHYHDNRIFPPHITADEALAGNWWYKPEYVFNELNINSAIAFPLHDEQLPFADNIYKTYTVSGYAYTGGGRMVTRVEVSTDGGVHWHLATLDRKEQPTEYGMYWCWVWWDYDLKVADLVGCKEICCRAWDASNNCQPERPTWNLMGMGNNHVFRLNVHVDKSGGGQHVFRFEHPTQPGQLTGGWMTKPAEKPKSAGFGNIRDLQGETEPPAPAPAAPTGKKDSGRKTFTLAEAQQHNTEQDAWVVINNKVYDCTKFLDIHPGGIDSIVINAGEDATEDFVAIHSLKATKMLDRYYVGDLDQSSVAQQTAESDELVDEKGNHLALNPRKKTPFRLQKKIALSRDSFLLDFALPTPDHVLGLPTGKHVFLSATIDGEMVLRRYTPISSNHDVGCVKFVIKAYYPVEHFPNGGKMSQYLAKLNIGDWVDFRGPVGEFHYLSNGNFLLAGEKFHATRFNMIAGGTGITPCMQVAAEIIRHPSDETQISLIFACSEEGDLLMRSTLDEWAASFPGKFHVHYILSECWPQDWKYSTGYVDKKLFSQQLYPADEGCYNLMCGPPMMLDRGVTPNLLALGHKKESIFSF